MRHRRISRSPGATVLHAGDVDYGQTPAPDCRVPAANGSGRILWTRRSNEGWSAGCPLDDPSFAAAVSTCSPTRKGATASLIHRPRSWNGARGHVPHPNSPGGAFRRTGNPVCLNRQRGQWGARRVCVVSRLAATDCYPVFAGRSSSSYSASVFSIIPKIFEEITILPVYIRVIRNS